MGWLERSFIAGGLGDDVEVIGDSDGELKGDND